MLSSLLSYESDDEPQAPRGDEAGATAQPPPEEEPPQDHGPRCDCRDCQGLAQRFSAKTLQTKGVRFRCKLCDLVIPKKALAEEHFAISHGPQLQKFKMQKMPALVKKAPGQQLKPKISFSRDDVLRKRALDEGSFGGWAKKEKPALPPREQALLEEDDERGPDGVMSMPPWADRPTPVCEADNEMDKEVDKRIREAQIKRFCMRNILEVNITTVRCKLCLQTQPSKAESTLHIAHEHRDDFDKELEVWHRFLYASSRRQPPFGWACKVCGQIYPSESAVWRHLGKDVFIRQEEKHMGVWHDKEDRWGHEENEECCGDGFNVGRLSYDSVRQLQEEAKKLQAKQDMADAMQKSAEQEEDESSGDEPTTGAPLGQPEFIAEF